MDAKMDMTPQKPYTTVSLPFLLSTEHSGQNIPFNSVIRSARCNILIIEKCPESSCNNCFCFSSDKMPFTAPFDDELVPVRFDILAAVSC